ncbi:MAG: hypothetical protein ACK5NT_13695 [Pyrinomonadaceae bacterium]
MKASKQTTAVFAIFIILFFANLVTAQPPQNESTGTYQLKSGTVMTLKMDNEINSASSDINDTFSATLSEPVKNEDVLILPVGTIITGRVASIVRKSSFGKDGKIELEFDGLKLANGWTRPISAELVTLPIKKKHRKLGIFALIGSTAIGALLGGMSGNGKGAAIGAGVGAGAGTTIALAEKGSDVAIGTKVDFKIMLLKAIDIPSTEY